MYQGRCSQKDWSWKRANHNGLTFSADAPIGTIKCSLQTLNPEGFGADELAQIEQISGLVIGDIGDMKLFIHIESLLDKESNVESFSRLKQTLEGGEFENVDRAIISVKKSPTQISTIQCGLR